MHWFVTDETNKNSVAGQFFIYGGLVVTDEQTVQINDAVANIRSRYGYLPGDSFKFNLKSQPQHVEREQSKAAKQEIVAKLEEIGARMIVYVILHDIAASKTDEEVMNYALNTVASSYHALLIDEGAYGLMLIDRADEQHAHLGSLFQLGINIDNWTAPLADKIVLFGMTANNESHLSSAVDIALGAFRYCVNTAGGSGSELVASEIFPPLARIIWGKSTGEGRRLGGYGYVSRPVEVRSAAYAAHYTTLASSLERYSGGNV